MIEEVIRKCVRIVRYYGLKMYRLTRSYCTVSVNKMSL